MHREKLQPILLSNAPVNAERAILPKRRSKRVSGSFTATKSFSKSSVATICVPAALRAAFKKCCLRNGFFDGSHRNYFFPRVITNGGRANLFALTSLCLTINNRIVIYNT
jgi:hypothetical protein